MKGILSLVAFSALSIIGCAPNILANPMEDIDKLPVIIGFPPEFTYDGETYVFTNSLSFGLGQDQGHPLEDYIPSDWQAKTPLLDIVSSDYVGCYIFQPHEVPCIIVDDPVQGIDGRPVLSVFAFDEFPNREVLGIEWLLYFKESLVEGVDEAI